MKKILITLLAIFSLFLFNDNVFASSSLDNFTFTEDDYLELVSYFNVQGYNISNYSKQLIIYDSGTDVDYFDFNNGVTKRDATVTLYMAKNSGYMNLYDDAYWLTYNQQRLDAFYIDSCVGARVTKNLETGEIALYTFDGCGSRTIAPMLNYAKYWLIVYSNFDISVSDKTIFTPDNNFDISGSIEQGTGALSQPNKTIVERIWDTIKGIFNSILSLPKKIGDIFISFFSGVMIDEEVFNEKLGILMTDIENKFGFISQTFDILIDIFRRFLNIQSGNHIVNVPEIKEPISGQTLINATTFDFDYVLSKNNISYLHKIYLSFVDVIVLFALVRYGLKQFNRIFGGGK